MSKRKLVFLLGKTTPKLTGNKLPSNGQVLSTFFHHHHELKKSVRESAGIVVTECLSFWERARIPTRQKPHLITKLISLFEEWVGLRKSKGKKSELKEAKANLFREKMKDLFDMAHQDALKIIKIQEDKDFLIAQREKGRRGSMVGVDKVLSAKEARSVLRKQKEDARIERSKSMPAAETMVSEDTQEEQVEEDEVEKETEDEEYSVAACSSVTSVDMERSSKRARCNIITPKLAAALDRAKVSDRKATLILTETARSLSCQPNAININRSSIRRQRKICRANFAASIKNAFNTNVPLVVHWDGKLLQDLTGKHNVERLPILISGHRVNKLLGVPKLASGTGENTASAISAALQNWGLADHVKAMCFDTTSANTGHRAGACILLEQKLGRCLLRLACRHHILELVLGAAFSAVMGSSLGPEVPLFKRFQAQWKGINESVFHSGMTDQSVKIRLQPTRHNLLAFYHDQLQKTQPRDDYLELIELAIIFLGEVPPRGIHFHAPGPMHHARWMSKVLYSLKVWLFRKQYKLTEEEEVQVKEMSIFSV